MYIHNNTQVHMQSKGRKGICPLGKGETLNRKGDLKADFPVCFNLLKETIVCVQKKLKASMYLFARTSTTKYHSPGGLKQQKVISSQFRRRDGQEQDAGRDGFLLCPHVASVAPPVLMKTPVLWNQGPTLVASFHLNYLSKGPVSKYNNILRYSGQGFNL